MKKFLSIALITLASTNLSFAQMDALKGSGKIVTQTFTNTNFDKLSLLDLDGEIIVEVGKTFGITAAIDDNLAQLLEVSQTAGTLTIKLQKNKNNVRYIEDSKIKITISLPALKMVNQSGNHNLAITNLNGDVFSIKSAGNGDATLSGTVHTVKIEKSGNGDVRAEKLIAAKAVVASMGNGDVVINATGEFRANGTGNGNIKNVGKATASAESTMLGNGKIISQ
ncbi:MAG: DUF2807 domain-containing protein [Gloeobacteraceae cyanobacterium ES-bin-316]|nr:DUF2807 domain-containing protein [Ferruginibacter sp.]